MTDTQPLFGLPIDWRWSRGSGDRRGHANRTICVRVLIILSVLSYNLISLLSSPIIYFPKTSNRGRLVVCGLPRVQTNLMAACSLLNQCETTTVITQVGNQYLHGIASSLYEAKTKWRAEVFSWEALRWKGQFCPQKWLCEWLLPPLLSHNLSSSSRVVNWLQIASLNKRVEPSGVSILHVVKVIISAFPWSLTSFPGELLYPFLFWS